MIQEVNPFKFISFLNSASDIRPKTKNKAINACCDCNESKNNAAYKNPERALTNISFTKYKL